MAVREATAPSHGRTSMVADLIRSVSRLSDRDGILAAVPSAVTRMGFERVILSGVSHGEWAPSIVHIPRDARWAADIREAGRRAPQRLGVGMVEDEAARADRPIVVQHVQGNPRVNRDIAVASRSSCFLTASVAVLGRPAAILHVDRYYSRKPFGADDVSTLQAVGDAVGMALERVVLREQLEGIERAESAAGSAPSPLTALTRREAEVAALIADGLTNPQIAAALFLAEATVKTHVKHILRKLDAGHRAELVSIVLRGR